MELTQHPLSANFPSMSEADYLALKDDIDEYGQREPIIMFEGMVLDGWHRYRACVEIGIEPTKFNFVADKEDPVAFVLSHNLHRRHLSASQRAAAVVACSAWRPARRENKVEATSTLSKTNAEMAKAAQVTPRTITDAKAAQKAGLGDAVKDGALTAEEAAKIARGKPAKKSKPSKKTQPARFDPQPTPGAEGADDAIRILSDENDRLNDRLAVVALQGTDDERRAAEETIAQLRALVKTMTVELDAVKASRDSLMSENGELKRQLASQRKALAKLKA